MLVNVYIQITVQESQHISTSLILFDMAKLSSLEIMLGYFAAIDNLKSFYSTLINRVHCQALELFQSYR